MLPLVVLVGVSLSAWSALAPGCLRPLDAQRSHIRMVHLVTPEGIDIPARRQATSNERKLVYVDGNNLMMQRKVTKGREQLAAKLAGIASRSVVLVFDGRPGEEFSASGSDPRIVITSGGSDDDATSKMSADDWIVQQVSQLEKGEEVEVVTADRFLRKETQHVSAKTINPVKWWRRYLPRLKGLKSNYSNAPAREREA